MSYILDGTGDYLVTTTKPVTAYPFSVSLWLKRLSEGVASHIPFSMGKGGTVNGSFSCNIDNSGNPSIRATNDAGTVVSKASSTEVVVNQWDHLVLVYTSATSRTLYLNNVGLSPDTDDAGTITWSNINTFRLGVNPVVGGDTHGKIGQVAVWNSSLSAANVTSLYNGDNPLTVATSSLVAYWPLTADLSDSKGSNTLSAISNAQLASPADDPPVDSPTLKYLKILMNGSAASTSGVQGIVFQVPTGGNLTGTKIGEFTNKTFEASLENNKAVLKVLTSDFGGGTLTVSDTPVALVKTSTKTSTIVSCTVIEE